MPRSKREHMSVRGLWGGENKGDDETLISTTESPDMRNADTDIKDGVLTSRGGRTKLGLTTEPIEGDFVDVVSVGAYSGTVKGAKVTGIFEFATEHGMWLIITTPHSIESHQRRGADMRIDTLSPLVAGTAGAAYTDTVSVTGGSSTYTWSLEHGSLPTGVFLSGSTSATETISGTIDAGVANGDYTFVIKAVDSSIPAQVQYKRFILTVSGGGGGALP